MRIIKKADETAEQARVRTQATAHGLSFTRLSALTEDITGIPCDRDKWDINVTGESPNKRSKDRP